MQGRTGVRARACSFSRVCPWCCWPSGRPAAMQGCPGAPLSHKPRADAPRALLPVPHSSAVTAGQFEVRAAFAAMRRRRCARRKQGDAAFWMETCKAACTRRPTSAFRLENERFITEELASLIGIPKPEKQIISRGFSANYIARIRQAQSDSNLSHPCKISITKVQCALIPARVCIAVVRASTMSVGQK